MKPSILMLLLALFCTHACTDNFEEINTNPNSPDKVNPDLILSNTLYQLSDNLTRQALDRGNGLAQYTAKFDFNQTERYDFDSNVNYWNLLYRMLREVNTQIELGKEQGNAGYEAIGLTLKSVIASQLTDLWGNVPYSEAIWGKSENLFKPAYDSQEAIYKTDEGILNNLRKANELLKNTNDLIAGDIMYDGDFLLWRKFTNTLRLRYLLRISNVEDVSAEMQQIVDEEPGFENNAESALIDYLPSAPNQFPLHTGRFGDFNFIKMSDTMEEVLNTLNDPRKQVWFRPTSVSVEAGSPAYKGLPVGLFRDSQAQLGIDLNDVSLLGENYREIPDAVDAVIISYSELQFILAEAAHRGLIIGGNSQAEAHYNLGITASIAYYGITGSPVGDYLQNPEIIFDESKAVEQIVTQKWLANFFGGYEGWLEFRCTGLPDLPPSMDNVNNDRAPTRYFYPTDEQALNAESYQDVISAMGGTDNINSPLWWDR